MYLPDVLPGRIVIAPGTSADYRALERFHYLPDRPSTWARIWIMRYEPNEARAVQIAVGVLSYPVPALRERDQHFGLTNLSRAQRIRFVNANLRTISRVIVHPQFRSLGLASRMVRHLCDTAPTRWVEAIAMMGKAHPLFERAGMTRIGADRPDRAAYYLWERPACGEKLEIRMTNDESSTNAQMFETG